MYFTGIVPRRQGHTCSACERHKRNHKRVQATIPHAIGCTQIRFLKLRASIFQKTNSAVGVITYSFERKTVDDRELGIYCGNQEHREGGTRKEPGGLMVNKSTSTMEKNTRKKTGVVRIRTDIHAKLKVIAAVKGVSIYQLISDVAEGWIARYAPYEWEEGEKSNLEDGFEVKDPTP